MLVRRVSKQLFSASTLALRRSESYNRGDGETHALFYLFIHFATFNSNPCYCPPFFHTISPRSYSLLLSLINGFFGTYLRPHSLRNPFSQLSYRFPFASRSAKITTVSCRMSTPMYLPFLKRQVALVTGSTSGIGRATAKCFAMAGADIVVHGPKPSAEDQSFLDELQSLSQGGRAIYIGADLSDREQLKDLIQRVNGEMGRLDILVNNAGIQHVEPFRTFDIKQWDALTSVNLTAPFLLMQHALPIMEAQKYGRIVNIASIQGLVGSKDKAAYNAAKHGLIGLTKSFTMDTAAENITANCICPGFTWTDLIEKQLITVADAKFGGDRDAALKAALSNRVPSLRGSQPDEIGNMAVYLCSPAAVNVKGASFVVDGGLTAA